MQTDSERNLLAVKKLLLIQRHFKYINRFDYSVLESFATNKNHFDLINSFFTSNPIPSKDSYTSSNIKETDLIIPGLQALTNFIFSQHNKNELIDFLTFSIIPSYFKFFLTAQSITQLANFFLLIRSDPAYTEEQFDLLARVVFLTPNFLSFSELVFQPIFNMFYDNSKQNDDNERINKQLHSNFQLFKYLLPKETFVVLKLSTNMLRTLNNSFMKIALSSKECSYLYNLFYPSCQEPSEKLLSKLQSKIDLFLNCFISDVIENNPFFSVRENHVLTNIVHNSESLDDLISKVNETNIYNFQSTVSTIINRIPVETMTNEQIENEPHKFVKPKHFFTPIDLFEDNDMIYFQEYFNPLFISSNDIQIFNFFNHKTASFKPSNEIKLFFDFNGTLSNFYGTKLNMNKDLKTFLLNANKIHLCNLQVTSFHDFLNSLLRTDSNHQEEEVIINLRNLPISSLMIEIENTFHFVEDWQIKHDFAIDHILPLLNYNAMIVEHQTTHLYNIFEYLLFHPKKVKLLSLKKYIKHQNLFENDFQKLKQSYPRINGIVILQRMFKETQFTMDMYLKKRENIRNKLYSYDQQMKLFFSDENNYISYVNDSHINRSVIEFANLFPNNYYNNPIDLPNHPQIEIICKIVIEAFLENSVLRKYRLLSLIYFMIVNEFGYQVQNEILDADNATLVSSLIFIKINPPNLITNILFLEDSISNDSLHNFFSCALFYIFNVFDTANPNMIEKELLFIRQNSPYKK